MSGDLAAFLAARLDEAEAAALAAMEGTDGHWRIAQDGIFAAVDAIDPERPWLKDYRIAYGEGLEGEPSFAHIVLHDPARTLREVQAKRTLLRYFTDPATAEPMSVVIAPTARDIGLGRGTALPGSWILREMAAIYSDHPDYDPEWKP